MSTPPRPCASAVGGFGSGAFRVYLLGARMQEIYPLVPLAGNQGLGIALFSYNGGLYWGLNADWDALPDIHGMVKGLNEEFESLHKAALKS